MNLDFIEKGQGNMERQPLQKHLTQSTRKNGFCSVPKHKPNATTAFMVLQSFLTVLLFMWSTNMALLFYKALFIFVKFIYK